MIETGTLQHNVERAVKFERQDGNGKPVLVLDPNSLEIEVFLRVKGSDSEPTLLGTYPVSELNFGKDE